jgi:oligosaccharide repeat unit polymerase
MNRLVLSLLLTLGVGLAALAAFSFAYWTHAVWLALMVGMVSYPFLHGYLREGRLDVFEPILLFVALYAFYYISRPLYIIYMGEKTSLLGFYLDRETLAAALEYCALGLFAFLVGYYWGRSRKVAGRFMSIAELDEGRAKWLATVCIAVGMIAYAYVIFVLGGGLSSTFGTERTARYFIVARNPYVANLTALIGVGTLVLFYLALMKGTSRWQWRLYFLASVAYGVFDIAFSGSRRNLVNIIFAMLMTSHYLRRQLSFRRMLPWLAMLLVFSFSWLYVRSTMDQGVDAVRDRLGQVETGQVVDHVYTEGENAIFDYLVAIINTVPNQYDYNYGAGLVRFLYFPIPRQLWPEKPENLSRVLTQRYDPMTYLNGGSAGSSLVGEFYLEFGWLGILPGALVLGFVFGRSYRWLLINLPTKLAALIYSCGAFSFIGGVVRGGLFGASVDLALLVLPVFLLIKMASVRDSSGARWAAGEGGQLRAEGL